MKSVRLRCAAIWLAAIFLGVVLGALLSSCASAEPGDNAGTSSAQTSAAPATFADIPVPMDTPAPAEPQTIVCIGDSITRGSGLSDPESQSYPGLLDEMLGDSASVVNLGVSAKTLMDETGAPYRETGNIDQAKQLQPEVFIVMLGTNDAHSSVWSEESYRAQLEELVDELDASTPNTRIVLMAPPCAFLTTEPVIDPTAETIIGGTIRSIICETAELKGTSYVDLFELTCEHPEWFPDGLHPDAEGHRAIAEYIYQEIFGG